MAILWKGCKPDNFESHNSLKLNKYLRPSFEFCWMWIFPRIKLSLKKTNFMSPFCGWGSTASRLEPLRGGSLLFTTKFPEIPGTHFIDLGRMKGWVDLGATQQIWTRDLWIGNPAPLPLGHCSIALKAFYSSGNSQKSFCAWVSLCLYNRFAGFFSKAAVNFICIVLYIN